MWKTPLRDFEYVLTHEGILFHVIHIEPDPELDLYYVTLRVIKGPSEALKTLELTEKTIITWNHISPDRFVNSQILMHKGVVENALEEEFFEG